MPELDWGKRFTGQATTGGGVRASAPGPYNIQGGPTPVGTDQDPYIQGGPTPGGGSPWPGVGTNPKRWPYHIQGGPTPLEIDPGPYNIQGGPTPGGPVAPSENLLDRLFGQAGLLNDYLATGQQGSNLFANRPLHLLLNSLLGGEGFDPATQASLTNSVFGQTGPTDEGRARLQALLDSLSFPVLTDPGGGAQDTKPYIQGGPSSVGGGARDTKPYIQGGPTPGGGGVRDTKPYIQGGPSPVGSNISGLPQIQGGPTLGGGTAIDALLAALFGGG